MSEVDKMFEKLGYKKYEFLVHIDYWQEKTEKIISFKNNKTVAVFNAYDGFEAITMQELQAIIKKCEELGWLDNNKQKSDKVNKELVNYYESRIQELEAKLEFKQFGDLDNREFENYIEEIVKERTKENYISKQKVKEALEYIEDYFERLNGPDEDIEYIRRAKRELLEGEERI